MRVRLIVGGVAVATVAGLTVPALAGSRPSAPATTVPPACVVVNGPNGLTVQAGYAPNGPSDCQTLP